MGVHEINVFEMTINISEFIPWFLLKPAEWLYDTVWLRTTNIITSNELPDSGARPFISSYFNSTNHNLLFISHSKFEDEPTCG